MVRTGQRFLSGDGQHAVKEKKLKMPGSKWIKHRSWLNFPINVPVNKGSGKYP